MTMILGEHHRTLGIFPAAVVDRLHSLGITMTSHNHVACNSTVAGAMAQICQETICVVGTKPQYSPRFAWGGRPHRRFISVRERG